MDMDDVPIWCASSLSSLRIGNPPVMVCIMHHASAGGDRLIVLTTLGVTDEDGASVLVGYDKTFL